MTNQPATETQDHDIVRIPPREKLDDLGDERQLRGGEHEDTDHVGVFLQHGLDDLVGCLM
jgi:hypothetical protein